MAEELFILRNKCDPLFKLQFLSAGVELKLDKQLQSVTPFLWHGCGQTMVA